MGQKINPLGFRIGITEGWRSRWYAPKSLYGEFLVEDHRIRSHIDRRLNRQPPYAAVSKIELERTRNDVKVILHTARPGLVIGPKGSEVDKLKDALEALIDRKVSLNIHEVRFPDRDAALVAEALAEQLKKRGGFRRMMKQRAEACIAAGARGVKITCAGRLGGSEMARRETKHLGSIPLHTLTAHVDYALALSRTKYGIIGVKVWLYQGRYGDEVEGVPTPRRGDRPRGKRA